jgi:hypothetical protein
MAVGGRHCTMNNPGSRGALEYLVKFYDAMGGIEQLNAACTSFSIS